VQHRIYERNTNGNPGSEERADDISLVSPVSSLPDRRHRSVLDPDKMGFQIFRNIKEAGYAGEIVPVTEGEVILGVPSVKSAAELPRGPTSRS